MRAAAVLAVMFLAACAPGVQHLTASGKPEATIQANAKDVKTAVVGVLANMGYSLKRDTDLQIVVERPIDNVMARLLLSSKYDPTIEARLTATVMPMGQQTRVTMEMGVVRNGGSAFEAVTPLNNSAESARVQMMLDDMKAAFASGKQVGEVVADVSRSAIARRDQS